MALVFQYADENGTIVCKHVSSAGLRSFKLNMATSLVNKQYKHELSFGGWRETTSESAVSYEHGVCSVHEVVIYGPLTDVELKSTFDRLSRKWSPVPGAPPERMG